MDQSAAGAELAVERDIRAFHSELRGPLENFHWPGRQLPPTISQAKDIVLWSLTLAGQDEDALLVEDVQERVARRHERFWDLYRSALHAFPPNHAEDRAREVIRQLASCFDLLRLSEAVRRNVLSSVEALAQPLDLGSQNPIYCSQMYLSLLTRWFGPPTQDRPRHEKVQLILHLLDRAVAKGYRRRGSMLCKEQAVVRRGLRFGTRFWKDVIDMDKFMHDACQKEHSEFLWSILVKTSDQGRSFVQMLEKHVHKELAEIKTQSHLISYQNGVLDMSLVPPIFTTYDDTDFVTRYPPGTASSVFIPQAFDLEWLDIAAADWFRLPTPQFQHLLDYQDGANATHQTPAEKVFQQICCNVEGMMHEFDEIFAQKKREASVLPDPEQQRGFLLSWVKDSFRSMQYEAESWNDEAERFYEDLVATPGNPEDQPTQAEMVQHLVRNTFPRDVQRWLYILLGRLLFPVGEHDDWQVIPFLKGTAGTGKSSIAAIVQEWFAKEDCGIISVNCEKTFGLQGLLGKRVWFMTEVKRNMNNFSQADFQSMVSGEHVSVAEKFRTATTEKWKAPGLLCGNECPGWFDSAGSLQRRIIVFPFRRRVNDKDARPNLTRSIKSQELGALLFKCAFAYLEAAYLKPNVSIWDMLPRFFSQEAMVMQSETDAVSAVLLDTKYELWQKVPLDQRGPRDQYWMLWSDFAKDVEYRSKVLRRSHFGETLTEDRWSSTFQKLELTVEGIPGSEDPEHPCLIKGIRIRRHQAPERTT